MDLPEQELLNDAISDYFEEINEESDFSHKLIAFPYIVLDLIVKIEPSLAQQLHEDLVFRQGCYLTILALLAAYNFGFQLTFLQTRHLDLFTSVLTPLLNEYLAAQEENNEIILQQSIHTITTTPAFLDAVIKVAEIFDEV